jgi:hypothetical protein
MLPDLAYRHPGYFKVVIALILTHIALSIDSLFIPAGSKGFAVIRDVLGNQLWALSVLHFATFALLVAGLYWRTHFQLLRFGAALSAVVFNFMAAGFAFAAVLYTTSFFGAIMCVAMSLSSVAAAKEPEDGPGGAET